MEICLPVYFTSNFSTRYFVSGEAIRMTSPPANRHAQTETMIAFLNFLLTMTTPYCFIQDALEGRKLVTKMGRQSVIALTGLQKVLASFTHACELIHSIFGRNIFYIMKQVSFRSRRILCNGIVK